MLSKIKKCDCDHKYQDSIYGKGKRLHIEGKNGLTCTVCGKINR